MIATAIKLLISRWLLLVLQSEHYRQNYLFLWLLLQGKLCCFADKCRYFAGKDRSNKGAIAVYLIVLFAVKIDIRLLDDAPTFIDWLLTTLLIFMFCCWSFCFYLETVQLGICNRPVGFAYVSSNILVLCPAAAAKSAGELPIAKAWDKNVWRWAYRRRCLRPQRFRVLCHTRDSRWS